VGDGDARADVEAAFSCFGPAARGGRVVWLGELAASGLRRVYRACDVLVWPGVNEAYGMTFLEAQAAGLAVVAGDGGGVREVVRDGETGILVDPDDGDALSAAVRGLLDDPSKRREMGRRGRRFVREERSPAAARGIVDKAVVHAGPTRQSRSDCEVIPLGELGGMLERLEVSQEAVAFVRDRMGPAPDDSDLEMLDAVYRTHIRPTLEGLESICRPLADQLFQHVYPSFTVNHGHSRVQIGGLLQAGNWERTKNQHIVTRGFRLNDAPSLELKHIYRFQGYTGRGQIGRASCRERV